MAKKNKRTTIQEIKDEYEVLNKYYEIYEILEENKEFLEIKINEDYQLNENTIQEIERIIEINEKEREKNYENFRDSGEEKSIDDWGNDYILQQLKDENNSLPSLKVLAEEEIPPYFKDITWEQRGAVEWTTFKHDNEDYFIGRGNGKVGIFLVKFNNKNIDESEIFYMKETPSFEDIEKNFEKYEHILKKIVPYTGNDERKKFTGE